MQLLTIEQVAERLAIPVSQVRALLRRKAIPWVNITVDPETGGKPRKRITESDLNAFIESRRVEVTPATTRRRRRRT